MCVSATRASSSQEGDPKESVHESHKTSDYVHGNQPLDASKEGIHHDREGWVIVVRRKKTSSNGGCA